MVKRWSLGIFVGLLATGLGVGVALSLPSDKGSRVYACVDANGAPQTLTATVTPPQCAPANTVISWSFFELVAKCNQCV